jgi:hypothetical protein
LAICNILRPFGLFCDNLAYFRVILYTFPSFGTLYQEKSGNPDLHSERKKTSPTGNGSQLAVLDFAKIEKN